MCDGDAMTVNIGLAMLEFYLGIMVLAAPIVAMKWTDSKHLLWLYVVAAPISIAGIGAGLSILNIIH